MKKSQTLTVVLSMVFSLSFGAGMVFGEGYGAAGCGLGSMLIGPKPGIVQVFAATTNGTSGSQTSGITSGTSNCDSSAAAHLQKKQEVFVYVNIDSLEQNMAAGHGETLNSLASLLGCPSDKFAAFGDMTRRDYAKLTGLSGEPSKLLVGIRNSLLKDPSLANACGVI